MGGILRKMLQCECRGREIVENCFQLVMKQRQPVLHSGMAPALTDCFVEQIVGSSCTEFADITRTEAADRFGDELKFGHWDQIERAQLLFTALRLRIKDANGFQRIAKKIQAYRHIHAWREKVKNAAADRIVRRLADGRSANKPIELQPVDDPLHADDVSRRNG